MNDMIPEKPVPRPSQTSAPFWDAAAEGKLLYQYCSRCDQAQYYPRALCSHCGSRDIAWRESGRNGTIHAITHVHIGLPAFKGDAPYDIVLVDIDEGFRMLVNIRGSKSGVAIGTRGEIFFEARGEMWLPQFRPDEDLP